MAAERPIHSGAYRLGGSAYARGGVLPLRLCTPPNLSWSGKRDSNPRLRPWQGRTLPLSYSRSGTILILRRAGWPRQPRGTKLSFRPVLSVG
jgi:hypothetical protein